jgi:hypothetical protein
MQGGIYMYNYPFVNAYNQQLSIDKLNEQINSLEKIKSQIQQSTPQPTNLTQNFQLAPTNRDVIRYANSIEEVQRDMVIGETPYFSKDMSVVWVKNTQNQIKTYELNEIVPKDSKDMQIEFLQSQIEELRKEMSKNEQFITNDIPTKDEPDTKRDDEKTRTTVEESKSASVSKLSASKKRE